MPVRPTSDSPHTQAPARVSDGSCGDPAPALSAPVVAGLDPETEAEDEPEGMSAPPADALAEALGDEVDEDTAAAQVAELHEGARAAPQPATSRARAP